MLWKLNLVNVLPKYFFLHAWLSIFLSILLSENEGQLTLTKRASYINNSTMIQNVEKFKLAKNGKTFTVSHFCCIHGAALSNTSHPSDTTLFDTTETFLHNMRIWYTQKSDKTNGTNRKKTADNVLCLSKT